MRVTAVYPNGNFHVQEIKQYKDGTAKCEFDVRQVTQKPVNIGDEIEFTDYKFHIVKTVKDGRPASKVIILSFGFKEI